ncbi:hypothetical protein [Photobacterium damselae]|uniref:hypothetical protein n=1 Tax=Photobacterium damselae TaxID=38293 RepID=UPI001F198A8C|nr:hypothetical protein [Photobacterium damselae]UKA10868.1 hypothetical protein IHC91_04105 [Photobacterium damselae subsp. damselae]
MILKYGFNVSILKPYLSVAIGVFIFIFSVNYYKSIRKIDLINVLNCVIVFNVIILYLQLILWYVFNYDLDIGKLLLGFGHRAIGFDGSYRATGVYDEPGIYGVFIYSLFVIRYLIKRELSAFDFIIILSIVLTKSFYSYILLFLFFSWYFVYEFESRFKEYIYGFLVLVLFFVIYLLLPRIDSIVGGTDYSTLTKIVMIKNYLYDNSQYYIYGSGLLPSSYWPNFGFQSVGDMTFFISSLIIYGIPLGALIIASIMILMSNNQISKYYILALTPLIKLTMLNWSFFWIYILCVRVALSLMNKSENNNEK